MTLAAGRAAGPEGDGDESATPGRAGYRWELLGLLAFFAISRVAYALAGFRFDASALDPKQPEQVQWQLLPLNLLRHDLLGSVWHLHSQPPLYNLWCGLLLHLPGSVRVGVALVVYLALGAVLLLATFLLLVELGAGRRTALLVAVVVAADPSMVLYEDWLSWSYPTAALLVVGTLGVVRLARTGAARWAALSAGCFTVVVLMNTTFQWPWLLLALVAIGFAGRRRLRPVILAACAPVLLVAVWCLNDAVQFGTASTSSWLGMNLAETTISAAPPGDVAKMIREGRLDQLASVLPFGKVETYEPRFVRADKTGVPALDQTMAEQGLPNYDNAAYLSISPRYLSDDLAYMAARPGHYLSNVTVAEELWSIPGDQYIWLAPNYQRFAGYARVYDAVVMLQPRFTHYKPSVSALVDAAHPGPDYLSWTIVGMTLIDLLVAPAVIYRRRRDSAWAATMALMWATVAYSFVVTTASEMSENMRFRFELGTLPAVLAVVTVVTLLQGRAASRSVPAVDIAGPPGPDVDS